MADEIEDFLRKVVALKEDEIFIGASDDEVLDHIKLLNQRQLIQGKNSEGELLSGVGGDYTDLTMEIAEAEGRPKKGKSVVDLFSEGDFHESIKVEVDSKGYDVTSDPFKTDPLSGRTTNLLERYGAEVEGLSEASITDLVETKLTKKYVDYIESKIF